MKFVCKLTCRLPRYRQTFAVPIQVFLYSSIKINKQVELTLYFSLSLSLYLSLSISICLLTVCMYSQIAYLPQTLRPRLLCTLATLTCCIFERPKNSWNSIAINSLALTVQINSDTQYKFATSHAFCILWVLWVLINLCKGFSIKPNSVDSQGSQRVSEGARGSQLKSLLSQLVDISALSVLFWLFRADL